MDVVELALAIVIKEEGWRENPYLDSLSFWTIGYGSRLYWEDADKALTSNPSLADGLVISREFGEAMARRKVATANGSFIGARWFDRLPVERKAIVIAMAYQLGVSGTFGFKRMIAALWRLAYETAATEMLDSDWAKQTPARAKRMAEAMRTGNIDYWRAQ